MDKKRFYLTTHAAAKVAQRVGMDGRGFLALIRECAVYVYRENEDSQYWLVWLREARRAHVFVASENGAIITVFPAIVDWGLGMVLQDERRVSGRVYVKERMLHDAMAAAGANPDDEIEAELLAGIRSRERAAPTHLYRLTLHYMVARADGTSTVKILSLCNVTDDQAPPAADGIEKARARVAEHGGWDALLRLSVRKTGEVLREISLDDACMACEQEKTPALVAQGLGEAITRPMPQTRLGVAVHEAAEA